MASKRQRIVGDYAEDSYTDEDDEMDLDNQERQQENRPRVGRPRKSSHTTNSSMDTVGNPRNADNMSPADGGGPSTVRRRGRGPSKRPCLNRNALMARENRQRKKEYVEKIETRLQAYQKDNLDLNSRIKQQTADIKKLNDEVQYLKSVLENKSRITILLQAMNDSLQRMHGNASNQTNYAATATTAASGVAASGISPVCKSNVNVLKWINSGQNASSKTANLSTSLPESTNNFVDVYRDDGQRQVYGQMNNTVKVARKTMPLNSCQVKKIENPSSIESIEEDEKRLLQKSSPNSESYCEYQMGRSSAGLDNQVPTTPMSALSNSLKNEASLSDTDFSQLSSFNVDLFDTFETEEPNPLQFEQDGPELFNDDTIFHSLDKDTGLLNNDYIDPLEISKMSDALNEKTFFNSMNSAGVCLHISPNKVSLEYCSICQMNSLKSECC